MSHASLLARIAGNIAGSLVADYTNAHGQTNHDGVAKEAVAIAHQIMIETDRHMKEWDMANPKKYRTVYVVTGTGDFPIDMLRYAESFPKNESEARSLSVSIEDGPERYSTARSVTLVKYHADPSPQLGEPRWNSFGWKLDHIVETVKL